MLHPLFMCAIMATNIIAKASNKKSWRETEQRGFLMAAEPIRSKKQLRQLAGYWLSRGHLRNYTLIVLGVCTALRISDLLRMRWADVYDEEAGTFFSHVTLVEQKTKKQKTIALSGCALTALSRYLPFKRSDFIFASNRKDGRAISRIQAWRVIKAAAAAIQATGKIACHSLRKTFGYFAWKSGVLPVMLMDIFNHSSFEITRRYLGISQDDRDKVYLGMSLF